MIRLKGHTLPWYRVGIKSTLHWWILAALCVVLTPAAAAQGNRASEAWTVTFAACLDYVETGRRDVFQGWDIAYPGGGVCNGDAVCETNDMTFVPVGKGSAGGAWVQVSDPVVQDMPRDLTCRPACCGFYFRKDVEAAAQDQLAGLQESGRVRAVGGTQDSGTDYEICAYDGREGEVTVVWSELSMHFLVELSDDAPFCSKGTS